MEMVFLRLLFMGFVTDLKSDFLVIDPGPMEGSKTLDED